jgi:hypothetical protein
VSARYLRNVVVCIVAAYIVCVLALAHAHATGTSRFGHYRDRLTGNVLIVKRACVGAEDSAYHLRTLAYDDGGARIVIGCHHRGY